MMREEVEMTMLFIVVKKRECGETGNNRSTSWVFVRKFSRFFSNGSSLGTRESRLSHDTSSGEPISMES